MSDLLEKIDEVCPEGQRKRHSYFQLQYFVIGKEPTIQAKLEACRNELLSRKETIEALTTSLEDTMDKKRLEEINIEKIKELRGEERDEMSQISIRQAQRRIKAYECEMESFLSMIRGKEDEANFLLGLYDKLCEIEQPKDWDSLEVQAEYWNARLTKEIESQLLLGRTPDSEIFKTVMALPEGMPIKKITNELIDKGKQKIEQSSVNNKKD